LRVIPVARPRVSYAGRLPIAHSASGITGVCVLDRHARAQANTPGNPIAIALTLFVHLGSRR